MSHGADQALFKAVERRDAARIRAALKRGANPNATRGTQTPLGLAKSLTCVPNDVYLALVDGGAELTEFKDRVWWAAQIGRADLVDALIELGGDVTLHEPVLVAVKRRSPDIVRSLVIAGADPNTDDSQETPLLAAIKKNEDEIACILLHAGADPRRKNPRGELAIAEAAARGNERVVAALIAAGADVNQLSLAYIAGVTGKSAFAKVLKTLLKQEITGLSYIGGQQLTQVNVTPLVLATAFGHVGVVRLLLEAGAGANVKDGNGTTPLEWAKRSEQPNIAKLLRNAGAGPRLDTPDERLIIAAEQGKADVLKKLVAESALLDVRDRRDKSAGRTPLMLAAANGRVKAVTVLLELGADPNLTDDPQGKPARGLPFALALGGLSSVSEYHLGRTALMLAALSGHAEVVDLLLRSGAGVDLVDYARCTALYLGAAMGHASIVRRLISAGANVNHVGPQRTTPLFTAVESGSPRTVQLLVDAGARVAAKNSHDESPLVAAAIRGKADIVAILLKATAGQGLPQSMLDTALQFAVTADCEKKSKAGKIRRLPCPEEMVVDVVGQLLDAGANPNARGDTGHPLSGAALRGYGEVALRLIDAGARTDVRDVTLGPVMPYLLENDGLSPKIKRELRDRYEARKRGTKRGQKKLRTT